MYLIGDFSPIVCRSIPTGSLSMRNVSVIKDCRFRIDQRGVSEKFIVRAIVVRVYLLWYKFNNLKDPLTGSVNGNNIGASYSQRVNSVVLLRLLSLFNWDKKTS